MRLLIAAAAIVGLTAPIDAQTPTLRQPYWPDRIAVGMRNGEQLTPHTVEASSSGWVTVNFLASRPDQGLNLPPMRLIVDARAVRRWTIRVRAFLDSLTDSTKFDPRRNIHLGSGRYNVDVNASTFTMRGRERSVMFVVRGCGPGAMTSSPSLTEMRGFLALLDSAVAAAGNRIGRPPTLSRAYSGGEVSCPAQPVLENAMPRVAGRTVADIGVQFVVDTSGLVERTTLRFLPGTDAAAAAAATQMIATWRFTPAEIDGTPVRQIVQMPVSFNPRPHYAAEVHTVTVEPTEDGWVHLTHILGFNQDVISEWYAPDSVDAWVASVRRITREGEALPRDTEMVVNRSASLGSSNGIRFGAGFFRHGRALEMRAGTTGCANGFVDGDQPVGDASMFAEAARLARARRSPPADPHSAVYDSRDVACPAWLMWTRTARAAFSQVWLYPVGAYPASMRGTNARADVFASFVVDTTGSVEPQSIVVIDDAARPFVDAVPASLRPIRFRPATRAGVKVRQRVFQTIRFEPPPICPSVDAGPACPRRYSDR